MDGLPSKNANRSANCTWLAAKVLVVLPNVELERSPLAAEKLVFFSVLKNSVRN